jgi:hypothetical protein
MRCTLASVGVPLGSVVLSAGEQTIASLERLPGYEGSYAREVARAVGIALRAIDWSGRLTSVVRTRALAAAIVRAHEIKDSLTLTDQRGFQLPVARIIVIEFPRDPVPVVVVNLRDLPAARGAELHGPTLSALDRKLH